MIRVFVFVMTGFAAALFVAAGLSVTPASAQAVAITNGRVIVGGDADPLDGATLIFQEERIIAVGVGITPPPGAQIIDAQGKWVTAGIFAPASRSGLPTTPPSDPPATTPASQSHAAPSRFSAALTIADAFDTRSNAIAATRMSGVTRAALPPPSGPAQSVFAGQGALVDHSGGPAAITDAKAFMMVRLNHAGDRVASWAYLRAALVDAKGFPQRYFANIQGDALNRADAGAFAPFARGEKPILIEADQAADLRRVIALARQQPQLDLVILGGAQAHLVADELANADIPVILTPSTPLQAVDHLAAPTILHDAGVTIAFAPGQGDPAHQLARLPHDAGIAVAHGLDWNAAFNAITANTAEIFGVDRDFGALEIGKVADIIVWDADPLEIMSAPERVFIAGEEAPLVSRQTLLRDRYLALTDDDRALPLAYTRPDLDD